MRDAVAERLREFADDVRVDISFAEPWTTERITEDGRVACERRVRAARAASRKARRCRSCLFCPSPNVHTAVRATRRSRTRSARRCAARSTTALTAASRSSSSRRSSAATVARQGVAGGDGSRRRSRRGERCRLACVIQVGRFVSRTQMDRYGLTSDPADQGNNEVSLSSAAGLTAGTPVFVWPLPPQCDLPGRQPSNRSG